MFRPHLRSACSVAVRPPRSRLGLERLEERSLLAAGLQSATLDLSGVQVDPASYDTSRILVRFTDPEALSVFPGTRIGEQLPLVPGAYVIDLDPGVTVEQALALYQASGGVVQAEADLQLSTSWTPNDTRFGDQWFLNNTGQAGGTRGIDIKATGAWNLTTGTYRTTVAVLDSGIDYAHPDLYLNIWLNQGEIPATRRRNLTDVDRDGLITFADLNNAVNIGPGKITDINRNGFIDGADLLAPMTLTVNGADAGTGGWADGDSRDGDTWVDDLVGWNSNANTNQTLDDYGHGTHIAGTIGATGNNSAGVTGVNWRVQLMPVKFFNAKGAGSISQFIAGLDYVLAKGVKISNNSWNDSGYTPILYEAVKRARDKGHLFVAAAGNNGRNTDISPAYPAGFNLDNVVSVGAVTRQGQMASFSNYGATSVDFVAPGVEILSTNPGKSYGPRSGTSMATPVVAGVAALVWGLRPEWNYRQVINWLAQTATRLPALTGKVGAGLINADAAVRVPARSSPQPGSTVVVIAAPAVVAGGSAASAAALPATPGPASAALPAPTTGVATRETAPATPAVPVIDAYFSLVSAALSASERRRGPARLFDPAGEGDW